MGLCTAAAATIVTARDLGAQGRGVLVLYLTVASFSLLVSSLGVNTSCRLLLVSADRPVSLNDFLGLCLVLGAGQALLCSALGAVLLPLVGVGVNLDGVLLLALLGAGLFGQYVMFDALNAYGLITTAAAIQALVGAGQLVAVLGLAALDVRTAPPFVLVLAVGGLVQVGVSLVALRPLHLGLRPSRDAASWRRLVRAGLPAVAVNMGQVLTFRIDRYLVGLFLGPAAVGVYSVASTAPELLRLPTMALGQPIFHRLASGSARLDDFRRGRAVCLLTVAGLAAAMAAVAPIAVRTVFGPEFSGAVTPMRILLLGEMGIALYYIDGSSLFGLGRIADVALASAAGLVVVTAGDLVLLPTWGIAGAAWASVPAYTAMGVITYGYLRRHAADTPTAEPPPTSTLEVESWRRLDA